MAGLLAVLDPDVVLRADLAAVSLGGMAELRGAEAVAANFKGKAQAARAALLDGALGAAVAGDDTRGLASTLRLMPVIQESISLDKSPTPSDLTWSVHDCTPSGVASMRVMSCSRAWLSMSVTHSTLYSMLRGMLPSAVCGPICIIMLGKPSTMMPR